MDMTWAAAAAVLFSRYLIWRPLFDVLVGRRIALR
jgi:hypothetical protein